MWKLALGLVHVTYYNACILYLNLKQLIQQSQVLNVKKSQEYFHQFILSYNISFIYIQRWYMIKTDVYMTAKELSQ